MRKELKDIQKEFNTTMIYITHDQEEAFAMSDKILVMDTAVAVRRDTVYAHRGAGLLCGRGV